MEEIGREWLRDQVIYDDMEGMKKQIERMIEQQRQPAPNTTEELIDMGFSCENRDQTFLITDVELSAKSGVKLGIVVTYKVLRCDSTFFMEYSYKNLQGAEDVIHAIFHCVYKMNLCQECFALTDSPHRLCSKCVAHKIREEYGRIFLNMQQGEICAICQEIVYTTRLTCGHFFHKTCMVRLNKSRWFSDYCLQTGAIRCPLCRQKLTEEDAYEFFLLNS